MHAPEAHQKLSPRIRFLFNIIEREKNITRLQLMAELDARFESKNNSNFLSIALRLLIGYGVVSRIIQK